MFFIIFPLTIAFTLLITLYKDYLSIFTDNIIFAVLLLLLLFSIFIIFLETKIEGKTGMNKYARCFLSIIFSMFGLMLLSFSVFSVLSSLNFL